MGDCFLGVVVSDVLEVLFKKQLKITSFLKKLDLVFGINIYFIFKNFFS